MSDNQVLFLSYNSILEPLIHSQGLPYIRGLLKRDVGRFTLLTFEKKENFNKYGIQYIKTLRYELKKEGIEWHFLYYHKKPVLLAKLFDISNGLIHSMFFVIFKRVKLIHARGIVSASIAFGLHFIFGVRFIFDVRTSLANAYVASGIWKIHSLNFKLVKFTERIILRNAYMITVETRHHLQVLRSSGYSNVEAVPCCVDLERFQYKPDRKGAGIKVFGLRERFYLVYSGSLGNWNMMDKMFGFFKAMNEYPAFKGSGFVLATSYNKSLITQAIKQAGIEMEKITILNLPHDKMPDILVSCNLAVSFIKPYQRLDSFPVKIGEYLASGLPIILNKGMGDVEDIVRENNIGVIIDGFSEEEYKNGLRGLEELLKEGDGLSIRCRRVAERYLSVVNGAEKYYQIYSGALN